MNAFKNSIRRGGIVIIATVLVIAAVSGYQLGRSRADAPADAPVLRYSGTLTDATGKPVSGSRKIEVSLWDAQIGGSQVCQSGELDVTLNEGSFSAPLPNCADAVHTHAELYIEVALDSESFGRSQLGAVPYAIEAHTARNAAGALAEAISALGANSSAAMGTRPENAASSCENLKAAGVIASGTYWIKVPAAADAARANKAELVYCDQLTADGGWALISNTVLAPNTMQFWNIPYAERTSRRGRPALEANFYDGGLYQTSQATYMDVIEDLRGRIVVAMVATSSGINNTTMRFNDPVQVDGSADLFGTHFAAGWSAPDYDGDLNDKNCANEYNGVTQHYGSCWITNTGSDAAEGDNVDGTFGPHVHSAIVATALGLYSDGTAYTRVRRLSRFVRW